MFLKRRSFKLRLDATTHVGSEDMPHLNKIRILFLLSLFVIGFIPHAFGLVITSNTTITIHATVPAPSLGTDVFGTSTQQSCTIFLPPDYFSSNVNYPVVYFIPGFGESTRFFESIFSSISTLNDTIVVLAPGYHPLLVGSFYADSSVSGDWENFIVSDVVSYIDSNFRTIANSSFRGIGGFSMGGYGALNIAMKHPNVFCATYGIAPGLFDENGLKESMILSDYNIAYFLELQTLLQSLNQSEAYDRYVSILRSFSTEDSVLFMLAYGSAFSPDREKGPPYIDYPYERDALGNIVENETVWNTWQNGFGGVAQKIHDFKNNLLSLKGIGVEYGVNDDYSWIPKGCQYFAQKLAASGIPYTLTVTSYEHVSGLSVRIRTLMMPFFWNIFGDRVLPGKPNFDWTPFFPKVGELAVFNGTASSFINGSIVRYEWTFGDGDQGLGVVATHAYNISGKYNVSLNIADSRGFWAVCQQQVQIIQPYGPTAEFKAFPTTIPINKPVRLDASASRVGSNGTNEMPITEYRWDFGDGNKTTATGPIIYHSYDQRGMFFVFLTVYALGADPETSSMNQSVLVTTISVGGYSIPSREYDAGNYLTISVGLTLFLALSFVAVRRTTKRRNTS
jgi:S-formylglutathione hydrolase